MNRFVQMTQSQLVVSKLLITRAVRFPKATYVYDAFGKRSLGMIAWCQLYDIAQISL